MTQTRQLAAIMFTDIVGYTALMGADEEKAFQLLKKNRQIQQPLIKQYNGTWIKEIGDGVLASFHTVTDAVFCAAAIHQACHAVEGLKLRIGIHLGEVIFEDNDVFGDGVNIASRLQAMASPGSTWVSEAVYKNLVNKKEITSEFIKEEILKNVSDPVKVYEISVKEIPGYLPDNIKAYQKQNSTGNRKRNKAIYVTAVLLTMGLITTYFLFFNKHKQTNLVAGDKPPAEKSIAVIPFRNMSNNPQQEYFAEGMMDEVLNHLYKIGDLNVISRTTSIAYKDSKKKSTEIASELGVVYLLEGSVQKEDEKIRIIVQLIDGTTDKHLWAETYDREFRDVFAIQSDIARQIATALKLKIDPAVGKRIDAQPTKNTEAYNLYLQAGQTYGDQERSLLKKAIALDPAFANAYSALATHWIFQGGHDGDLSADKVLENALPLIQKALELNPDLVSAHVNLALINLYYKLDFKAVETEYRKILKLNPSDPQMIPFYSDYLLATEKFKESLHVTSRGLEKDKNFPGIMVNLALSYFYNNEAPKALELIKSASTLFGNSKFVRLNEIRIKNYAGYYEEAIQDFIQNPLFQNNPAIPYLLGHMSVAYYKTQQPEKAKIFLDSLIVKSKISSIGSPKFFIAAAYSAMGKKDTAMDWLEKAYTDKEVEMYWVKVEPLFTSLHGEPRFEGLLKKIGFD